MNSVLIVIIHNTLFIKFLLVPTKSLMMILCRRKSLESFIVPQNIEHMFQFSIEFRQNFLTQRIVNPRTELLIALLLPVYQANLSSQKL